MTPLDQAFIKAYARQEPAASAPLDERKDARANDASLRPEVAPEAKQQAKSGDSPAAASPDAPSDKLMLILHQAHRDRATPPAEDIKADEAKPAEATENREAAASNRRASSTSTAATPTPTLEDLGFSGVAYRLDRGAGETQSEATSTEATESSTVPPPHIDMAAVGRADKPETTTDAAASESKASGTKSSQETPPAVDVPMSRPVAEATAPETFLPMLQVDGFLWPQICRRLSQAAAKELDRLGRSIKDQIRRGRKTLAIGGCAAGEGATTMLLCVGKLLAGQAIKVIMVDANRADPKLAKRLGMLPESGWKDALCGRMPLEEVVIEAVDSSLALLPLCQPTERERWPAIEPARLAEHLAMLRRHYDLVLVDLGPWENSILSSPTQPGAIVGVDAVVLVHNVGSTDEDRLDQLQRRLARAGIEPAGIVQNFVRG